MRDDIHKGAPLKRHWKLVAQMACGSFAKWATSGTDVASDAARKEAQDISDEVLNRVAEALDGASLRFVPLLPKGKTAAEKDLVALAGFSLAQGETPTLNELCEQTLQGRLGKVSRVLRCHAARADPAGSKTFMHRADKSLASIPISSVVAQRLSSRNQAVAEAPVDLRNWNRP